MMHMSHDSDNNNNKYGNTSNKPQFYRMFPKPQILSKEQRHNPFQRIPAISEDDFQKGLAYLVNKGMVPKDFDLTPAFEKGHPPIEKA